MILSMQRQLLNLIIMCQVGVFFFFFKAILFFYKIFTLEKTSYCYKVISNGANNTIISAHEDKRIRFYDLNSNDLIYTMVAHQDAVTDLDIDASNMYLLSSSHDCSLRLWNIDNKNCIQEITAHRKKYDEAINCIGFHKTRTYIASGGADAIAKIYV